MKVWILILALAVTACDTKLHYLECPLEDTTLRFTFYEEAGVADVFLDDISSRRRAIYTPEKITIKSDWHTLAIDRSDLTLTMRNISGQNKGPVQCRT